ncbi:MAG TPA: TetR/AcrR family transcriptional regulator [Terriglobales bacterium]|nr:TetR/AcrR family transcriptional regulator [Terriglobales bacterium]
MPAGRRERRRAETREKIYLAAMKLFAEHGFFETTTEAITEAADVGQGTFFNYFPTKPHVLTVLTERQMGKIVAAREEAEAGRVSIQEILHRLTHVIAEEPGQSPPLTRSLLTAMVSSDAVREFIGDTLARARKGLGRIIKLGQRRGEIRGDRQPADLAVAFQRGVLGTLLLWAIQPQGELSPWLEASFRDFWAAATPTKGRV